MSYIKAPKESRQEMYDYLEELRQLGDTNMFGATPYLQAEFAMGEKEASADWMQGHSNPWRILKESVTGRKAGRMIVERKYIRPRKQV